MRTLMLPPDATPRAWGELHGETFRYEIQALAELREWLSLEIGRFESAAQLREIAAAHLPALEAYDPALYQELCGIAAGAAIDPALVVILNHYTDLRDIVPDEAVGDEGCSILYDRTPEGAVLAQTWDMHASAIPYALMLNVPATDAGPEAWVLSLTGCVGMAGMNTAGVGVSINNLRSTDARVGVVWPALVRRALRAQRVEEARDTILQAPIGSGHHYMVASAEGAYGIETSGQLRKVIYAGEATPYVHTNHCLDPEVAACSAVSAASSTQERFSLLSESLARSPLTRPADAWIHLGSHEGYPRSVCSNLATPQNPHASATCSAISMDLGRRRVYAAEGFIHAVPAQPFPFREVGGG